MTTTTIAPPPAGGAAPHPLLAGAILPTLLRLALPTSIAMVATALVAIAETAYVGLLGKLPLAGLALVFPMVMLQQTMSAGAMGGGISSAVSRALGAGNVDRAAAIAQHAFLIGSSAGIFFFVVFQLAGSPIYSLLGGRDGVLAEALAYSNVVFFGAPAIWLANTFASILRGTGNMVVPSVALLAVAGAQIVLGGTLGLGLGPVPRLGMAGVALGQVIAFSAGAFYLYWHLASGRARITLRLSSISVSWDILRDILKVGAVACISPVQTILSILIITRLVSALGTDALAGYGIGARLEFLLIPITFAIGVASVPMVGMAVGAGDVARARRVAWMAGAVATAGLTLIGLIVALYPLLWAGLFTSDPAILASASTYLRWAGPFYGLFGLGLCLYFASQGSGKILGPVLAGTARLLVVLIGGIWLVSANAPAWQLFALVGVAMAVYGAATAFSVWIVDWGPQRRA
ncbi:MATE family efflux transporter [Hyphomicrobium sp. CS1BSMeth3]|uniref:MATE family efflux transporter n=1 Tax=Hyphomicrobium sp. CS1BSMeth3 TaxID=1892844 RepID=UPI0009302AE6|nr:MATE family efflux transporter [Hyphomicrobium sp. CS1BSMeth3]